MLQPMSLSRRQFFRRFWNTSDKSNPRRNARYEELKSYVRTCCLPYDFSLTEWESAELFAEVQILLESATDEELFSDVVRVRIDKLVEGKVQFWRQVVVGWAKEIRNMAVDHVNSFLVEAPPEEVDRLKQRFVIDDTNALEAELKNRVRGWLDSIEDEKMLQYDVTALKDRVFAELRTWC
jgi:hypothetical protein